MPVVISAHDTPSSTRRRRRREPGFVETLVEFETTVDSSYVFLSVVLGLLSVTRTPLAAADVGRGFFDGEAGVGEFQVGFVPGVHGDDGGFRVGNSRGGESPGDRVVAARRARADSVVLARFPARSAAGFETAVDGVDACVRGWRRVVFSRGPRRGSSGGVVVVFIGWHPSGDARGRRFGGGVVVASSSARGRCARGRPKLPRGSNSRHSFDVASAFGAASSRFAVERRLEDLGVREGRPARSVVLGSIRCAVVASSAARRPDAGLAAERRALRAASLSPVLGRDEGWCGARGDSFSFEIPPAGEVPPCDAPPPPPPDDEDARFCLKRSCDDAGRRVPSSPTMSARAAHRVGLWAPPTVAVDFLEKSSISRRLEPTNAANADARHRHGHHGRGWQDRAATGASTALAGTSRHRRRIALRASPRVPAGRSGETDPSAPQTVLGARPVVDLPKHPSTQRYRRTRRSGAAAAGAIGCLGLLVGVYRMRP